MSTKGFTVSQVAKLAHVSIRTLHHYDEIGLLSPSDRTEAGYRLYDEDDLARLHQILLFRELGFTLEAIGSLLDEPLGDRQAALRAQRELLVERVDKTRAVIAAVDRALTALEEGRPMETEKMFEGFGDFDHAAHEAEARERWGNTEAFKESLRRTKRYGKADWDRIKSETGVVEAELIRLLDAGASPDGAEARAAAERHRLHIDRWFYPCDHALHVGLAGMYLSDPRFTAYYEKRRAGLARFLAAAIEANAALAGRSGST